MDICRTVAVPLISNVNSQQLLYTGACSISTICAGAYTDNSVCERSRMVGHVILRIPACSDFCVITENSEFTTKYCLRPSCIHAG